MVEIPKEIQLIVEDYIRKIRSQIPVQKAILFGSYTKGTFDQNSDVDLAIFSDYFEGMSRVEGTKFLLLQAFDYGIDLEPQAFTGKEYSKSVGIVEEIIEIGIEISA
jgi:predicted nucleotidyltransferase